MLSHYLKQCWNIIKWNFRNKLQCQLRQNSYIFIKQNAFENAVCEMATIFSRPQCVNQRKLSSMRTNISILLEQKTSEKICWSDMYQKRLTKRGTWINNHISYFPLIYQSCPNFKCGLLKRPSKFYVIHGICRRCHERVDTHEPLRLIVRTV